jgi:methanogenic corrinoid protein MtbC1
MSRTTSHRVAVVVIAEVSGVDVHDAGNRLAAAVSALFSRSRPDVGVLDVVELGVAARNGYLTVQPAPRLPHE